MEIQLSNQYSNHLNKLKVAQNNFDCKQLKKQTNENQIK